MTTIAIKHDLAGDLTDRMLLVEPEVIETRIPETEIAAARNAALPDALGAALDLVGRRPPRTPGCAVAGPTADGRLRPRPRSRRHRDRLGHPAHLPGPRRGHGQGTDRRRHVRPGVVLANGVLWVRQSRLRPKYLHGCGDKCGQPAGSCPSHRDARPVTKTTTSRAGRHRIGLPDQLVILLSRHCDEQAAERARARNLGSDGGWVSRPLPRRRSTRAPTTTSGRHC
jgi:hypothetical protein